VISPHYAFYKALVWPAFAIGAEAELEKQRVAIREVLAHLWVVWRAGNVTNALRGSREIRVSGNEELWCKPWILFKNDDVYSLSRWYWTYYYTI
jgi:hypothetical protein